MGVEGGRDRLPKRILWDIHNTTFFRNNLSYLIPTTPHEATTLFQEDERLALQELRNSGNEVALSSLVCVVTPKGTNSPTIDHVRRNLPDSVKFAADTLRLGDRAIGIYHEWDNFVTYSPDKGAIPALKETARMGIKNTIITSIPECCAPAARRFMKWHRLTPYLDRDLPFVMRRFALPNDTQWPDKEVSPSAQLLVVMALSEIIDGETPDVENDSERPNTYAREIYHTIVDNPGSRARAERWNIISSLTNSNFFLETK